MNGLRWIVLTSLLTVACRHQVDTGSVVDTAASMDAESVDPAAAEAATPPPTGQTTESRPRFPGAKYREAFEAMAREYEAAIRQDRDDAAAHAGLAEINAMLWCFGFRSREEVLPAARAAAIRAVRLDDRLGAAHTALGIVTLCDWDWESAEEALLRAVELAPDDARAHHWLALHLAAMGRHEEALAASNRAVSLEPESLGFKVGKGAILYFGREFEAMRRQMLDVVALDPDSPWAHDWLGMAEVQLKRLEDAIRTYEKAVRLSDGTAEVLAGLGHAYGLAGRTGDASRILDELESMAELWYVPPVQRAYVCVGLKRLDRAFELLEEAYRDRAWELVFLRQEPWFDAIREDARFVDLEKRMRFP